MEWYIILNRLELRLSILKKDREIALAKINGGKVKGMVFSGLCGVKVNYENSILRYQKAIAYININDNGTKKYDMNKFKKKFGISL